TTTSAAGRAGREAQSGKTEYATRSRAPLVHVAIGKKSFEESSLIENYAAVLEEIVRAKPAAAKGRYIKTITISSTMGPGVHVDPTRIRDLTGDRQPQVAAD